MKNLKLYFVLIGAFFFFFGAVSCQNKAEKNTINEKSVKDSVEIVDNNEPIEDDSKEGEIPLDYPRVSTNSQAGDYALSPSLAFIERAYKNIEEGRKPTFIFYHSTCMAPGKFESKLNQNVREVIIPNSVIIPIPSGQKAKKGDIVLTWWQSGSGMQRAIVVDDSDPSSPIVKYLDIDYDNPAKNKEGEFIGKMSEKIKPNSFVQLKELWQVGTSVAYLNGDYEHWRIINISGDKVLAGGWAGTMAVLDKARCTPIPVSISVKKGDIIMVPQYAKFSQGTVIKADNTSGRVWVKVEFAGKEKEIVVSQGDIIKSLSQ
jgi:hypothetical protein